MDKVGKVLTVIDSVSDRIVPSFSKKQLSDIDQFETNAEDIIIAEGFESAIELSQKDWEQSGLAVRLLKNIKVAKDIDLIKKKKLFTLNMAHSMTAYLGALWGYESIYEAIQDPEIQDKVTRTLKSVFKIHQNEWQINPDEEVFNIITRFNNEYLYDPVSRVGRSALSKLKQGDRLTGVAVEFLQHNVAIDDIAEAIAAAILYYSQDNLSLLSQSDEESAIFIEQFLQEQSGLNKDEHDKLISLIKKKYEEMLMLKKLGNHFAKIGLPINKWKNSVQIKDRDVFVVKAPTKFKDLPSKQEHVYPKLYEQFLNKDCFKIMNSEEEKKLRILFSELVRAGEIKPQVIINIKDIYPEAVAMYIKELIEISELYNGNVSFVLVKTESDRFNHDFPDVFSAYQKAKVYTGGILEKASSIHITDGGRKVRNATSVLPYGFQGLLPYSHDKSYVHEAFFRIGTLLLQLPNYGENMHITAPSDSLFEFTNLELLNGSPIPSWDASNRGLLLSLVPTFDNNISNKVIAETNQDNQVQCFLAKPSKELFEQKTKKDAKLWTLPFLLIWDRFSLDNFLEELSRISMHDGKPMFQIPSDFFITLIESIFTDDLQEWLSKKPNADITINDWLGIRQIAINHFGEHGKKIEFMKLKQDAFNDEGHVSIYKQRVEGNFKGLPLGKVKKYPKVLIYGGGSLKGRNIVIKGNNGAKLYIGKNVTLNNVLIDLGSGGKLTIPDNWVITDSFIGKDTRFNGKSGFLNAVIARIEPEKYFIMPAAETFKGNTGSTIVTLRKTQHQEATQVKVYIPFAATHELIRSLRFGVNRLSYQEIQSQADVVAHQENIHMLREMINLELQERSFPLYSVTDLGVPARGHENMEFNQLLDRLKTRVLEGQSRGQCYWITIEGIQSTGKTFLGEKLRDELIKAGKHVVFVQEDWYHKSREERERLREVDVERWKNHRQNWHRWDKYHKDWERLATSGLINPEAITLSDLYLPETGLTRHQETINLYPDTIFIVTGFYINDNDKWEFPQGNNRLKICISLSPEESLASKLKRDTWRSEDDVRKLDRDVYRPAFSDYTELFQPDSDADYVLYYNIPDYSHVDVIQRFEPIEQESIIFVGTPGVVYQNQLAKIEIEVIPSNSHEIFSYVKGQDGKSYLRKTRIIRKGMRTFVIYEKERLFNALSTEISFVALAKDALDTRQLQGVSKVSKERQAAEERGKEGIDKFDHEYKAIWMDKNYNIKIDPLVGEPSNSGVKNENISQKRMLEELGLEVDVSTGKLYYSEDFVPLKLSSDIWLIRHGQTFSNASEENRFQGQADDRLNQLTETGRFQAKDTAKKLARQFSENIINDNLIVLTSPLSRAKETALEFIDYVRENLSKSLYLQEESRLSEINFGEWENMTEDDIRLEYGDEILQLAKQYRQGDAFAKSPSGESFIEFLYRVKQYLQDIGSRYSGKKVLLFGHGTYSRAVRILMQDSNMIEDGFINWRKGMLSLGEVLYINQPLDFDRFDRKEYEYLKKARDKL
jgi:broad specificity phosphatase PhoE/uridine kinase